MTMDSMTGSMMSFNTANDGLPMPEFVSLDPKCKCIHCSQALNQPQQLPCGHRICKLCLDGLFSNTSTISCPSNEQDCDEHITRDMVHPDFSAQRDMKKFLVYCLFRNCGCNHEMPWAQYKAHLDQCKYRLQQCKFCHDEISLEQFQNHIDNQCPMVQCLCPHGCQLGPNGILRCDLQEHLEQCPRKPRPCHLQPVGCQFHGMHDELFEHQQDHWHHIELLMQMMLKGDHLQTSTSQSAAASYFGAEDEHVERLRVHFQKDFKIFEQTIHNELKTQLGSIETKLNKVGSDSQNAVADMNRLKAGFEANAERAVRGLSEDVKRLTQAHKMEIHKHQMEIEELQKILNATNLQKLLLAETTYDGTFLWRIFGFSKRLADARDGHCSSIFSPPFFSSRYGYKMSARMYPNGDGEGHGTHVSLFVAIMQGDFDDILTWPFSHQVICTVIDQSEHKRHHLRSFRPDLTNSSFQKPLGPINVATGFPCFIGHDQLMPPDNDQSSSVSARFLKNDNIYIRIRVNTESKVV